MTIQREIRETVDWGPLERRLSECFEGGARLRRELRLSQAEAGYIAQHYAALLRPMGEQWYEITFQGAMIHHGD